MFLWMSEANTNPLEVARLIVASIGIITNLISFRAVRRVAGELWRDSGIPIGRRHLMAWANQIYEVILLAANLTLWLTAYVATHTVESGQPLSTLAYISNLGQIVIGMLLTLLSIIVAHTLFAADLIDMVTRQYTRPLPPPPDPEPEEADTP